MQKKARKFLCVLLSIMMVPNVLSITEFENASADPGVSLTTDKYTYNVGETVEITLDGEFMVSSISLLPYIGFMVFDSNGDYVWEQPKLNFWCLMAIGLWQGPSIFHWNQTYRVYDSHYGDLIANPPIIPYLVSPSWEQVPCGKYYVYYSINGGESRIFAEIEIIQPVEATIDIDPDTLNLKSKGRWITAYLDLPEGYDVNAIDIYTVALEGMIPAEWCDIQGSTLIVKFDRSEVEELFNGPEDDIELIVNGLLYDGTRFEGSDTIQIINPPHQ